MTAGFEERRKGEEEKFDWGKEKELLGDLPQRMGITKEVRVVQATDEWGERVNAEALGDQLPSSIGPAIIRLNTATLNDAVSKRKNIEWALAHELSHIANNDLAFRPILFGISGTTMAISLRNLEAHTKLAKLVRFCFRTNMIAGAAVVTILVTSQMCEKRADLEAFAVCSQKGKEAGLQLLREIQQEELAWAEKELQDPTLSSWKKIIAKRSYAFKGDNPLDLLHPRLSKRIAYLEKTLV
jgi:Zn-dependent protease with chaperone function